MSLPDVRKMDPLARFHAAEAARLAPDIEGWPDLECWNSAPCARHARLVPSCPRCGVVLRRHQRVGAAWLYFAMRGLLADQVGLGKTFIVAAVLAMAREAGELSARDCRAVIVARPAALGQWRDQLARVVPSLRVIAADGTPAQRVSAYLTAWDACVISPQTLSPARGAKHSRGGDIERLEHFPVGIVVYDDTDAMRAHANRSARAIKSLAAGAPRVIGVHGTPLQKRMSELHSFLEPVGGDVVFGTERQFRARYVTSVPVSFSATDRRTGRTIRRTKDKDTGLRQDRVPELKALLAPLVLRRRAADIEDAAMPGLVHNVVWLDPSPAQRRRYDELRDGILRRIRETGEQLSQAEAVARFIHGWQICSGLATLDDNRDDSVKLDWAVNAITGDLEDDKAVVFVNFKPNVAALAARLKAEGVGCVLMWGNEQKAADRNARLARFRDDPSCRVLIGTTTIEQSLNLQAARHLIACDTLLNPARMTQLAGRVRRQGSAFATVYLHQLLLRGTQEEHYLTKLEAEQAQADTVWSESGELFHTATAAELTAMITGQA